MQIECYCNNEDLCNGPKDPAKDDERDIPVVMAGIGVGSAVLLYILIGYVSRDISLFLRVISFDLLLLSGYVAR